MKKEDKKKLSPSFFHLKLLENTQKSLSFSKDYDFEKWREKLKRKFKQLIGKIYKDKGKVEYEIIEKKKKEGYILQKIVFPTNPYVLNIAYLLIPENKKKKYPAMICLQGHSPGAHISIGEGKNKEEEELIKGDRDFAIQAVKNGFVALAVEQRCFGERKESLQKHISPHPCHDAVMHALMLGHTLISERIADVMRGIDLLYQFPFVDKNKIGCMGNSGGGTITFYSACIDKRIKVAIPSCSFCTYEDSIMKIYHCADNYIPSSLKYFGMEDLAGLIVPRYLIIVAGEKDEIFPISGVKKAFSKAKRIYKFAGFPDRIKLVIGKEGHRFYAKQTWPLILKIFSKL